MGANNTGDDITIGEYNKASSGTVLSLQPFSGVTNFSDAALVVDSTAFLTANAIRAQAPDGAAVLAINMSGANAAVSATNDLGTGVSGTSGAKFGIGVFGKCDDGTGVFGGSSSGSGVVGNSSSGIGVFGECSPGSGVHGSSPLGNGTVGESLSGIGVRAISQDGVAAFATSIHERAGVFLSGSVAPQAGPLVRTSKGGIAQVRLVPSTDPKLPTKGSMGDLFVHLVSSAAAPTAINLYLCVNDQPVQWQQVQLAPGLHPGGATAP